MATITKKELVNRIADKTGQTKVVTKEIIQLFLDEIIGELSVGNRLEFREFGVFEVKPRKARRAQNPRTLEKVNVPPKKVVKFKVGRIMREKVGEGEPMDEPISKEALPTKPLTRAPLESGLGSGALGSGALDSGTSIPGSMESGAMESGGSAP